MKVFFAYMSTFILYRNFELIDNDLLNDEN